jgi:ribonuclease HI
VLLLGARLQPGVQASVSAMTDTAVRACEMECARKWNLETKSSNDSPQTMTWARMSFKGQVVWVRADDGGRPVLDAEGRAEMKYRESDPRSYRPLPQNLGAASAKPAQTAETAQMAKPATRPAPRKPPEEKASASGKTVHVWTDGACSGNPGPMGIGVVVVAGDRRKEHGEYLGKGTNNIAELTAIRRGLEIAEALLPGQDFAVRVYTDSSYAIGLLSQGWKAKANQALVAELRDFLQGFRNLRMIKVAGHAGVPENERCDVLAREAVARNRLR